MFSNFISLGSGCPVAASMMKYGLRSWSGPFDWLIAENLKWVLYFMENDFDGFMEKNNLISYEESDRKFKDTRSGFIFIHDQEYPFMEMYEKLQEKYGRKVERFISETQSKSCFLRACTNATELEYISKNSEYINKVIRKNNKENEIIFLLTKNLKISKPLPFRYYLMPSRYASNALRNYFDQANEFLEYCAKNFSAVSILKNIAFEQQKEEEICKIKQKRYNTLVKLCNSVDKEILLPADIIIYGTGNIGRFFYRMVKKKCNVVCFVDKKEAGKKIDGIDIKRLEEIRKDYEISFVITATYDFDSICNELKSNFKNAVIISLDDLI